MNFLTKFQIFLLFVFIQTVKSVRYCNLCSDPSIETHFGGFFVNPRDLQDGYRHNLTHCDKREVALQECEDSCFSLNVTSLHIKSKKLLPFGVSYGCSSMILQQTNAGGCIRKDIVLKTVPPYVVQADYCFCTSSECNEVHISPRYQHQYSSESNRDGKSFYGYSSCSSSLFLLVGCISILSLL